MTHAIAGTHSPSRPSHFFDRSYLDHLVMIKIRAINIDIKGPQDSLSEVGEGSIDM